MTRAAEVAIADNIRKHDAVGAAYDSGHPEIFNDVEQARLAAGIRDAVALVSAARSPVRALDVGCGTGNLTAHLIDAGARVTAADVSTKLLERVRERFGTSGKIDDTVVLNGRDLGAFPDNAFDVVATYSVLHHVPDYVALVREMARVAAPGGIVIIDHERSDTSWTSPAYAAFLREAVVWPPRRWWYWLQPSRYWKRLRPLFEWRRWGNPRWMPEGDLHIWPDDHIEWAKVEGALTGGGCDVVRREQYLLYEPRYQRDVWERWRARIGDMQVIFARKRA